MFAHVRAAFALAPTFAKLLTADHVDLDVFLAAADRFADAAPSIGDQLLEDPALAEIAARPMTAPLPAAAVLMGLPEGTVGRVYAEMMVRQSFSPIDEGRADSPETRVRARLEATHDLWHVATGFGTSDAGEIGLQAFYLAQITPKLPLILLIATLVRALREDRSRLVEMMDAISTGWTAGRAAEPLAALPWEDLMDLPLEELRARLGLVPVTGELSTGLYAESVAALAA